MNRDVHDFALLAQLGRAGNAEVVRVTGRLNSVPKVNYGTWARVSNDYAGLAAPANLEILSASAADDGAPPGVGAHTAQISGLDNAGAEQTDIVTLDGVNPVNVGGGPSTYSHVNFIEVLTGTDVNHGSLTLRVAGGGATVDRVPEYHGISYPGGYMVGTGKICSLIQLDIFPLRTTEIMMNDLTIHVVEDGVRSVFSKQLTHDKPSLSIRGALAQFTATHEYTFYVTNDNYVAMPDVQFNAFLLKLDA